MVCLVELMVDMYVWLYGWYVWLSSEEYGRICVSATIFYTKMLTQLSPIFFTLKHHPKQEAIVGS
jgi:hypothetical protein